MNAVAVDIWPSVLTTVLGLVVIYIKYIHQLRTDVAELKGYCDLYKQQSEESSKSADALKVDVAVLQKTVEEQQKTLENMAKRMDSHSKKQDAILETVTELKVELVKSIGNMSTELGSLASDMKNLNRVLTVYDNTITFNKQ